MKVLIWIVNLYVLNTLTTPVSACVWSSSGGGSSSSSSSSSGGYDYSDCPPGYSNPECRASFERDECASYPCVFGATCEDLFDEYYCRCRRGFDGEHCEHDIEKPSIICPPNQVHELVGNNNTMVVYWDPPVVDDNSGYDQVTVSESRFLTGSIFREGDTLVSYVATDQANNTNACAFHIHLDRSSECTSSPCQNGATCEILFNNIKCFCKRGYTGDRCEHDIEPPAIICPDDVFASTKSSGGAIATWHQPTVSDNLGMKPVPEFSHESGDVFPVGMTTVSISATDNANNPNRCTFKVTVVQDIDIDLRPEERASKKTKTELAIGIPVVICILVLVAVVAFYMIRRHRSKRPDDNITVVNTRGLANHHRPCRQPEPAVVYRVYGSGQDPNLFVQGIPADDPPCYEYGMNDGTNGTEHPYYSVT